MNAQAWGRRQEQLDDARTRNAKSIDEKESVRWLDAVTVAATAARRWPRTQLVVMADREGDLYELHDAIQIGPPNLHSLIRAQHDRNLEGHQKLWEFSNWERNLVRLRRKLKVPRRRGRPARSAEVGIRWAQVTIQAPAVGPKKGWPPLNLWAIWVYEDTPPHGAEQLEWMLFDRPPHQHLR